MTTRFLSSKNLIHSELLFSKAMIYYCFQNSVIRLMFILHLSKCDLFNYCDLPKVVVNSFFTIIIDSSHPCKPLQLFNTLTIILRLFTHNTIEM